MNVLGAPHSVRRRWLKRAVLLCVVVSCIVAVRFAQSLDSSLQLKKPSHLLLDRHSRYLGEFPGSDDVFGYWPLPAVLPEKIVATTLETEDRKFHEHNGVNFSSVGRAILQNVRSGEIVSGASTIAMQVARMQHPQPRTLSAKLHEAAEGELLIREHGHDVILRQYLTIAPYGNRTHGIVRAARLYFDKPVEDLSWLQAAFLAALPQQPGRMSPFTPDGRVRAFKRAHRILTQLHDRQVIDDDAYRIAMASDLNLVKQPHRNPEALHAVLAWSRFLDPSQVIHQSTLDLDIQHAAATALKQNLKNHEQLLATQTAGLVVDTATGDILAYVGSADYFNADDHGAIDFLEVKRSPGSALKPFIYGEAIEKNSLTGATELPDTPAEFSTPNGGVYVPENITHTFLGPMLARQALANSRNIPALRVLSDVGVGAMTEFFERGGVKNISREPDAYGLTMAIGSLAVTPMEMATLYTSLANNGTTVPLRRFADEPQVTGAHLLSSEAAQLVRHMLADPEARRPGFPAGSPLDFDYAVAIKTGTSQGYRDAWTAAFSDRLLVVTWLGNHDTRRMNLASGATVAAPAAHQILDEVMPGYLSFKPTATSFPPPENAVAREVCALSGKLPGPGCSHVKTEFFIRGSEPTASCGFHIDVPIDARNGLRAGPTCPREHVIHRAMLALPETYALWARRQNVSIAPTRESPLCPQADDERRTVVIKEPARFSRYLYDPDTPREYATLRLSAKVTPANATIVWLVDGRPLAEVGYPHEMRWSPTPGKHVIRAAMAHSTEQSAPVSVVIDD